MRENRSRQPVEAKLDRPPRSVGDLFGYARALPRGRQLLYVRCAMPNETPRPVFDPTLNDVVEHYKRVISVALDGMDLASIRDLVKEIEDQSEGEE